MKEAVPEENLEASTDEDRFEVSMLAPRGNEQDQATFGLFR
jgi:hypothetical protein